MCLAQREQQFYSENFLPIRKTRYRRAICLIPGNAPSPKQLSSAQNSYKAIYTSDRWTQTHIQFSLLDNLAGYSSEDGLEDSCLSADFKLHSLEISSYKALLGSAHKHYQKCPGATRHLPHCGFTSVVHSHVLLHSPPASKVHTQSSSNYYCQHACVLTELLQDKNTFK